MTGALAVQKAVIARLAGDPVLAGLVCGVHDQPPPGARLPYVALGRSGVVDWSTKTERGARHRLDLIVHADHRGQARTKVAAERILALVTDTPLEIDGQDCIAVRPLLHETVTDPAERLVQTILRVEVTTLDPSTLTP